MAYFRKSLYICEIKIISVVIQLKTEASLCLESIMQTFYLEKAKNHTGFLTCKLESLSSNAKTSLIFKQHAYISNEFSCILFTNICQEEYLDGIENVSTLTFVFDKVKFRVSLL